MPTLSVVPYTTQASGLRHLLQSEGVRVREHGITADDAHEAARLYASGLTISQLVEKIGSSYGTVRKVLHERGVALRAGGQGDRVRPTTGAR